MYTVLYEYTRLLNPIWTCTDKTVSNSYIIERMRKLVLKVSRGYSSVTHFIHIDLIN